MKLIITKLKDGNEKENLDFAIWQALSLKQKHKAMYLLENGFKSDNKVNTSKGISYPIYLAINNKYKNLIEKIVERSDVEKMDEYLEAADDVNVKKELRQYHPKFRAYSCLFTACESGDPEIFKLALEAASLFTIKNGDNIFHTLIKRGRLDLLKLINKQFIKKHYAKLVKKIEGQHFNLVKFAKYNEREDIADYINSIFENKADKLEKALKSGNARKIREIVDSLQKHEINNICLVIEKCPLEIAQIVINKFFDKFERKDILFEKSLANEDIEVMKELVKRLEKNNEEAVLDRAVWDAIFVGETEKATYLVNIGLKVNKLVDTTEGPSYPIYLVIKKRYASLAQMIYRKSDERTRISYLELAKKGSFVDKELKRYSLIIK